MYLIEIETGKVIAEVDQEWVKEHKEEWVSGVLAEMGLTIVPSETAQNSAQLICQNGGNLDI